MRKYVFTTVVVILCVFLVYAIVEKEFTEKSIKGKNAETSLHIIHLPSKSDQPSLSVLIKHKEISILIDGGWDEEESKRELIDYLKTQGVSRIDYIISTHAHADHTGGLTEVIRSFDIGTLFIRFIDVWSIGAPSILEVDVLAYENLLKTANEKRNFDGTCIEIIEPNVEGYKINIDSETYFKIYNCTDLHGTYYQGQEVNHLSLMVHFVSNSASAFIGGDATNLSDKYLINNVGQVDVYSVQHHGTALPCSSAELLAEIRPTYSVVSGPLWAVDVDTRARCERYGKFFVTGEGGTIVFEKRNGSFIIV